MTIIDPPVSWYSPLADLRAWEADLERQLALASAENRPAIERALRDVRKWIVNKPDKPIGGMSGSF